jgi:benzoyl-CoA reductase/2-hydroxyglutaryl-CoA dehydratase subunit BcrC/BadD/HgdB
MSSLERQLSETPARLSQARKDGVKVVGYFCPHVPEELILAGGMIPLRLTFGGEAAPAMAGEEYLKPYSCPYARSCVGYRLEGKNEYYQAVDALCVAQTCENLKLVQAYWEKYFNVPVFSLGIPHTHDAFRSRPQALEYFKNEIELLRGRLGGFGGRPVKDADLRRAISLCNKIREKLHILYAWPMESATPVDWNEILAITQAGYLIDRRRYLDELAAIEARLAGMQPRVPDDRPRLMIAGSIIATGDTKLLDLIKAAGGNIVADSICTGSMFARKSVTIFGIMGSPVEALAERYLYNIPCPCMTDLDKRLNRMLKIARDYRVAGLIYYSLKYCDTWRAEFQLIKEHLFNEVGIPSLLVESDYAPSDVGTIQTKVEAFIEMLGGLVK